MVYHLFEGIFVESALSSPYKAERPHISVLQKVLHLDFLTVLTTNDFIMEFFVGQCLVSRTLNNLDIFGWNFNFSNVFSLVRNVVIYRT